MESSGRTENRDGFRPDIEGLRGVAVVLVVIFHSGLVALTGGFIGVDVFFVISGFLITGLLIRERERSGAIRLPAFYARRVRRLLPAGLLALLVTLVGSFLVLAPLDRASAALDAAAAALSVGNIRFALQAGDYFAAVSSPSPFLHFWSLAVEEQFYLAWPVLILLAARGTRPRLAAGVALGVVFVLSLAANLVVSASAANWAFYSLPTRAWQLALGGLLALGAAPLARIPPALRSSAAWVGGAALIGAAVAYGSDLAYPGGWALVPTLAAAALIVAGTGRWGPGRVLASPPIRFMGRISYSLYLWHWPILVLPAVALEAEPPPAASVGLVVLSICVAWTSWRFVEEPFRTGFTVLGRAPGRTILAGATAIALVVGSTRLVALAAETASFGSDSAAAASTRWNGDLDAVNDGARWDVPTFAPSAVGSPDATSRQPSFVPRETPAPTSTVGYVRLPSDVRPSLRDARTDEERLRADGCLAFETATRPAECVYGDPGASFTAALVGDSHAAQWFPALERVARHNGWRILTFVKVSCPFLDMRVMNVALKREYTECAAYREATIARLRAIAPDLTLVSLSRFAIHPVLGTEATTTAKAAALARAVARIPGRVAILVDTPDAGRDVPSCLSSHLVDVRRCAIARDVAHAQGLGEIERAAADATVAQVVDLTDRICRGDPCPVVVDGMIVFRDIRHLTATFAASLAPDLDRALIGILMREKQHSGS